MNVTELSNEYFEEHSSDEGEDVDSSDENEELESFLTHHCHKKCRKGDSSEDEFEAEMEVEQMYQVHAAEAKVGLSMGDEGRSETQESHSAAALESQYYDDIYFDSDSDGDEEQDPHKVKRRKEKRRVLTNDELFYDPDMDRRDQEWVDNCRQQYQPHQNRSGMNCNKPCPLPNSDAVLNCPACFTVLCLDCQRHELYVTQYRAMFVLNCIIDWSQCLKYPGKAEMRKKKKLTKKIKTNGQQQSADMTETRSEEKAEAGSAVFHPVRCTECNTEVAVYDINEVYHFFNTIASY